MHPKPHIVITMGDPAGIGPEVCYKGLSPEILEKAHITLTGEPTILEEARERFSGHIKAGLQEIVHQAIPTKADPSLPKGQPSQSSGNMALEAIRLATDLCLKGDADAMVTAPVSKEAIELSGVAFTGHTEWISTHCGDHDEMMMMSDLSQKLHIGYLSTHIPLAEVPKILTKDLVERRLLQCLNFRSQLNDPRPVAICGLNPHAGENGLLGNEEKDVILPVLDSLRSQNQPVQGPFPADTLFIKEQREKFSVILALYHDQGGIPFKMLAFDQGVNHTLGLPIIRTSVDHGTAWDIAWKGSASGTSMSAAIEMAILRASAGWKEPASSHNNAP